MGTWFTERYFVKQIGLVTIFFLMFGNGISLAVASGLSAPSPSMATDVIIIVKTREFQPNMIALQRGEKIRFILRNKDAELHAFVPIGLFIDTTHNVSGNGAPQFAKEGLIRVLLPSTGQTEIMFTPEKIGKFPFFCDLPGHVMRGTIVVQE